MSIEIPRTRAMLWASRSSHSAPMVAFTRLWGFEEPLLLASSKDEKIFFDLPANGTDEQADVKKIEFDFECLQKID